MGNTTKRQALSSLLATIPDDGLRQCLIDAANAYADRGLSSNGAGVQPIRTLIEHAKETYPHFESERGQRDIAAAEKSLAELLAAARSAISHLENYRDNPGGSSPLGCFAALVAAVGGAS